VRLIADAATAATVGHDGEHNDHCHQSGQCGSDPQSSAREWHLNPSLKRLELD